MNQANCHSFREALDRLIDGDIEASSRAALLEHVETCPSCRSDYEWIRQIGADLESMGGEFVSEIPEIDIIASVMSALPNEPREPESVASFAKFEAHPRTFPWRWTAAAAAAAAIVVAGWITFGPDSAPDGNPPAGPIAETPEPQAGEPRVAISPFDVVASGKDAVGTIPLDRTLPIPISPFPEAPPDDSLDSAGGSLTRDDITRTYVASLTPDSLDGIERLLALAEINREQAAEILADAGASPEAQIAAAQIVGGPEGAQALFDAVGRNPESPYLRAQLAQSYSGNPATQAQALEQTTALRERDPRNAYWAYLDAERLFGMGEMEAGMELLRVASQMETLTTYPLEGARNREQYMVESGIDPELAHLLSSLTAGILEMDDLSMLASNLIGYGDAARENGDEATAEAIFQSVANLGMQVDSGAVLVQERNTAAIVTDAATASLQTLSDFLDNPETVEQLLGVTSNIVSEVATYFGSLTETLLSEAVSELQDSLWGHIADSILMGGDLTLVDTIGDFIQQ